VHLLSILNCSFFCHDFLLSVSLSVSQLSVCLSFPVIISLLHREERLSFLFCFILCKFLQNCSKSCGTSNG